MRVKEFYLNFSYNQYRKSISKHEMQKHVKELVKEVEWLQPLHSQTLQDVTDRLEKSYDRFFRNGAGFPKFAKRHHYRSFSFKQGVKRCASDSERCGMVYLPKIGEVRYINSRDFQGTIKRTSIIRETDGWYIALEHVKIKRIRQDFLHKLTSHLICENQAITVEALQIQNMMQHHHLAKSIADASWYEFTRQLEYKAAWNGRRFSKVSARNTSKLCSVCGSKAESMPLSVREWTCEHCGRHHDRDINAAINIKEQAIVTMAAVGQTVATQARGNALEISSS